MSASKLAVTISSVMLMIGCVVSPGAIPGGGYGPTAYTPALDLEGVDQTRYGQDLADCRKHADTEQQKVMIGSAIAGAVLGGVLGNSHDPLFPAFTQGFAVLGGGALGATAGAAYATPQWNRNLLDCMAGRAYRITDGSAQTSTTYPSPYLQKKAVPVHAKPTGKH
jgi:hypothetical protein